MRSGRSGERPGFVTNEMVTYMLFLPRQIYEPLEWGVAFY